MADAVLFPSNTVSGAQDLEILKGHFTAAISMLPKHFHDRIIKAKDDRKAEMTFSVIGDILCAWASQK